MRAVFAACVTVRGLLIIAAIAGALQLTSSLVLAPQYREITGFAPFDLQSRLSPFMIGVELGAFEKAAAAGIYRIFAGVDFAAGIVTALLFSVFWTWIFTKAPARMFDFLKRGGVLMLPAYAVVLDAITKVGYARLLGGLNGPGYAETIEFCATVHRLKFALIDIRNVVTLALLVIAAIGLWRSRMPRAQP